MILKRIFFKDIYYKHSTIKSNSNEPSYLESFSRAGKQFSFVRSACKEFNDTYICCSILIDKHYRSSYIK